MNDDPTQVNEPRGPEPRVLGGRYEIGDLIGRGGMADVHIGHDLRLGRTVAIKILRTDLARDSVFLARFRREAQAAAGLSHPSIVGVFDSGEEMVREGGGADLSVPYIVMEFIEGLTLREVLNERTVLDPDEAARVTAAVLAALEYAHDRGLVHRDIKPANVMVTAAGAVKVMDFGIARALADTAATMTQTQAVMGTARYLSPEQAQGLDVDGRSDLYSVGCLLYELLAGRTPFKGDPVSLVYQHLGQTPVPPSRHLPSLPPALDAVTLHALEKKPEDRYQSAGDFRADLNAARAQEPVSPAALTTHQRVLGGVAAGAGAAAIARSRAATAAGSGPTDTGRYADGTTGTGAREPSPAMGVDNLFEDDERWERTDEMPVRERRHPGAALLLGALALLAVAGVAWVLWQVVGPGAEDQPDLVVVPSTVGMVEERARSQLTTLGLTVPAPSTERNSAEERGVVIEQTPPGGELPVGSEVVLVVSAGPEAITVPSLAGLEEQVARDQLAREGFTNVRAAAQDVDDPERAEGEVVGTDPEAGQQVDPGREIVLAVSTGLVEVPSVVGQDQNQAVLLLNAQNLRWDIETRRTGQAVAGTVLEQSVEAGERVEQDSEVGLVVAIEPIQTQTETRTVDRPVTVTLAPPAPPAPPAPTTDPEPTEPEPTEPEPTEPEPTDPDPTDTGPTTGEPGDR